MQCQGPFLCKGLAEHKLSMFQRFSVWCHPYYFLKGFLYGVIPIAFGDPVPNTVHIGHEAGHTCYAWNTQAVLQQWYALPILPALVQDSPPPPAAAARPSARG